MDEPMQFNYCKHLHLILLMCCGHRGCLTIEKFHKQFSLHCCFIILCQTGDVDDESDGMGNFNPIHFILLHCFLKVVASLPNVDLECYCVAAFLFILLRAPNGRQFHIYCLIEGMNKGLIAFVRYPGRKVFLCWAFIALNGFLLLCWTLC